MITRRWFESDGPIVPVMLGHVWVGETIEPLRDGDTLVIRIGEPIGPPDGLKMNGVPPVRS